MTDTNKIKFKICNNLEFKSLDDTKRSFSAVITSNKLDSDGEVILPEGVAYKEYVNSRKGLFYNHDYETKIGEITKIRKSKDKLIAEGFLFNTPGDTGNKYFDLIDYIYFTSKQSEIVGLSIGYHTISKRRPTPKDLKDYGKETTEIITDSKLMEISITPIPSNTDSRLVAMKKLSQETKNKFFPKIKKIEKIVFYKNKEKEDREILNNKKSL